MALLDSSGHPLAPALSDDQIIDLMAEEIRGVAIKRGTPIMELPPQDLLTLVGAVQLASRHPELPENALKVSHMIVAAAREYFSECPTVLEIIARGEDPAFDE